MQYGSKVLPYKRNNIDNEKKIREGLEKYLVARNLIYLLITILMSRVILINADNTTAPFGVAFFIAVAIHKRRVLVPSFLGSFIGYLSIYNKVVNLEGYLFAITTVIILSYIMKKKSKRVMLCSIFSIVFIELLLSEFLIRHLTFDIAFLITFLQIICIFPLYCILQHSIICLNELRTKHLFTSEEIVSMCIIIALSVSGAWGINILGISLRNILALASVIMISYINGSTIGASSGIAIGVTIGVTSNNMLTYIAVYGICGFVSGIFKEIGKILTGFSYVATFFIVKMYCNINDEFKLIEIVIGTIIFLLIPNKIYERATLELDWEKKQIYSNKDYINKIKDILMDRLTNFSSILYDISNILKNLANNDKLVMKNKSSALVENLADRVCGECRLSSNCWKKEGYYTYSALGELIQNYQEGKRGKMPKEIERKCIQRTILLKNTEEIVSNYIINEMWRKKLSEGREILSGQINNIAVSLKEVIEKFGDDIKLDNDGEKRIRKILDNKGLKYNDLFCFKDSHDRYAVKLELNYCGGAQLCIKKILPLVNEALGINMSATDEGCSINPESGTCNVTFEQTPKYHITSYVARQSKPGEKFNGDSYSFGKIGDGSYMCIISDGMGSGPEASEESRASVDLIEKFSKYGISKETSINIVNSIMSLKFSEEEKFSTLDLSSVDLYTGNLRFMKVGAVSSFIKSGSNVEVIGCKSLPIGVLDEVDISEINKKVKNGDIIVMLSDGVLDYDSDNAGKVDWIVNYLKESTINSPKELVQGILAKSKELSGGKAKDDMTAIVSKVYSLY